MHVFLNVSVIELQNFMRKYVIADLLIFKYWWQNISVSNTVTCLATSSFFNRTHRACETVQLLTCETPDFIAPALWPANSPDLNLVNYQIGGSCRSVYRSRIYDVDQLKSCLTEEWLRTSELLKFAFFEYICIYFHGHLQKRLILTSLIVRDIT